MIRRTPAVLSAAVLLGAAALVAAPSTPAQAVGVPVMIDDFGGHRVGARTVTLLPEPGTATNDPATFDESGGLATMTMDGNGNTAGAVNLDYALDHVDLTSGGSNTQFFLEFGSIQRLPVQAPGEVAASITIRVTDANGVTGTYNTGIANIIGFNVVLNFHCLTGPPCFSPEPDFTNVTGVSVDVRYPTNFDDVGSMVAVLDAIRTTPTGGVVPSAPSPQVSVPSTDFYGLLGDSVTFTVAFNSSAGPAAVTHAPPSDIGLRAQDVVTRGTASGHDQVSVSGGPATYQVSVGPLTSPGTVGIDLPAEIVTDAWGQDNVASSNTPTVTFRIAVPPTLDATDPTPFLIGQASLFAFSTTAGLPPPTYELNGTPLPAGLSLAADGTLSGTPAPGTAGNHTVSVRATNVAGSDTEDYTLVIRELPSLTGPSTTSFVSGSPSSFTVDYAGFPLPGVTVSGRPAWLTATDDGTGTITFSGTPPASAVGSTTLDLTASNVAGLAQQSVVVDVAPVATTVLAEASPNPAVYGEQVVVTATVVSPQAVSGDVQFSVDGVDVGDPVTAVSGSATSPPLTGAGGAALDAGSHEVTAEFVPDDAGATGSTETFTLVIDKALTNASVEVLPDSVRAHLSAVPPGAGTPTGTVTFNVNGTDIGEAELVDGTAVLDSAVPADGDAGVSASYAGDANFVGSAVSTLRRNPVIDAAVTSAKPPVGDWYGSPVTVTFTCAPGSAPLVKPCPDPVTLSQSYAAKTVERTVRATDGGVGTVARQLHIDLVRPTVRSSGVRSGGVYYGRGPRIGCVGDDELSGLASCKVVRVADGNVVHYRVIATDQAGNTRSARGYYRVLSYFVQNAPFRDHAFDVHVGRAYTLVAKSPKQPRYFLAAPAPTTPFERGPKLRPAGHDRWALRISITRPMAVHDVWKVGVRTGGKLHVLRLHLHG
jgi:hypothetical protein